MRGRIVLAIATAITNACYDAWYYCYGLFVFVTSFSYVFVFAWLLWLLAFVFEHNPNLLVQDKEGWTCLHYATRVGNSYAVSALLGAFKRTCQV